MSKVTKFVSRPIHVEAIQYLGPSSDTEFQEIFGDLFYINAFGGRVLDLSVSYKGLEPDNVVQLYEGRYVFPTNWVVSYENGMLAVLTDGQFKQEYTPEIF